MIIHHFMHVVSKRSQRKADCNPGLYKPDFIAFLKKFDVACNHFLTFIHFHSPYRESKFTCLHNVTKTSAFTLTVWFSLQYAYKE